MNGWISLEHLAPGQSARVRHIQGQAEHVHRLQEFGLHPGTEIEMFRQGNPCIIRLAGNKVCLRADEKLDVLVQPAGTQA